MPADQQRTARRAPLDVQAADALGRVQLVAGEREQIHVPILLLQIQREFAYRLGGVGVEDNRRIGFLRDPGELGDGKNHARLIVRVHDADQQGFRPQGPHELVQVQISVAVDSQERHRHSRYVPDPCRLPAPPGARRSW